MRLWKSGGVRCAERGLLGREESDTDRAQRLLENPLCPFHHNSYQIHWAGDDNGAGFQQIPPLPSQSGANAVRGSWKLPRRRLIFADEANTPLTICRALEDLLDEQKWIIWKQTKEDGAGAVNAVYIYHPFQCRSVERGGQRRDTCFTFHKVPSLARGYATKIGDFVRKSPFLCASKTHTDPPNPFISLYITFSSLVCFSDPLLHTWNSQTNLVKVICLHWSPSGIIVKLGAVTVACESIQPPWKSSPLSRLQKILTHIFPNQYFNCEYYISKG